MASLDRAGETAHPTEKADRFDLSEYYPSNNSFGINTFVNPYPQNGLYTGSPLPSLEISGAHGPQSDTAHSIWFEQPGPGLDGKDTDIKVERKVDPKTGRLLSQEDTSPDGRWYVKLDPVSQRPLVSDESDALEGWKIHSVYQKGTGNMLSWDLTYADGTGEHYQMDARTGNLISGDLRANGGTTEHQIWNPQTGRMQSFNIKDANGTGEDHDQLQYKSDGFVTSDHVQYSDGRSAHVQYVESPGSDPELFEQVQSRDVRQADGTTEHVVYNQDYRYPQYVDIKHPDGSTAHVEWDVNTGKPRSVDEKSSNGSTQSFLLDPKTGRYKASLVPSAVANAFNDTTSTASRVLRAVYGLGGPEYDNSESRNYSNPPR